MDRQRRHQGGRVVAQGAVDTAIAPTADSHTAALLAESVQQILRNLAHEGGTTIVAVTHDGDFASAADRRIGLVDGKLNSAWRPA